MSDNGSRSIDEFTGNQPTAIAPVGSQGLVTEESLERRLAYGVAFGLPVGVDDTGALDGPFVQEVRGNWATVSLTGTRGTVTFTHNLGIPPTTVTGAGGTANLPNCRMIEFLLEFGDRTGAVAAPAAPVGAFNVAFLKMVNGTVTEDAITFEYSVTGFTPDATHPLTVTGFFVAAAA